MKLFFDTQIGSLFSIGVDFWDTVLTMKQKIEKSQRIPVSKQTLFFGCKVLQDNLDVKQCQILPNSSLYLFVSPDHNPNHNQVFQTDQSPPSNSTEQIIDYYQDSTVLRTEQSPSSISVKVPKKRIVVNVSPYSGENKGAMGIPVTVKMSDNVKELRNELVKIEERGELNLPQEGYFFIHKNRVLNENQPFFVTGVHHTDTIEILPRHLTRGSFNLDS